MFASTHEVVIEPGRLPSRALPSIVNQKSVTTLVALLRPATVIRICFKSSERGQVLLGVG
jgi:hypothetical protein